MDTVFEIQPVTYSKYYGPVGKVLWYEVNDEYNEYVVNLKIYTGTQIGTTIAITNFWNVPSNPEFEEYFAQSPYGLPRDRAVEIFHVPSFKSVNYVVLNTPYSIL